MLFGEGETHFCGVGHCGVTRCLDGITPFMHTGKIQRGDHEAWDDLHDVPVAGGEHLQVPLCRSQASVTGTKKWDSVGGVLFGVGVENFIFCVTFEVVFGLKLNHQKARPILHLRIRNRGVKIFKRKMVKMHF